ncbi:hypothetical protein AaE_001722 [Aphanomyces astaci]|uniref:Uncharacterized protein n=1 Tax=Aphanomyces astaci TaxID=112090 RepID=A0A6A5ABS5_APHAT|nr:hypothetical protein AaE_001722 [Aphanomyces astaci]
MVKVLLSGDVGGNWDALHARVEKLHTSAHGPFDVVLCAGFSDVSANAIRAWPLPVYVLGGLGDQPKNTSTNLHIVSENSVHTISGLHVAFLADPEAVQSFRSALTAQPVDLLITTDYPQGYKPHNLRSRHMMMDPWHVDSTSWYLWSKSRRPSNALASRYRRHVSTP